MTTNPSTAQHDIDPTALAPNTVVEGESYTTRRALYVRPGGYAYRYDGKALPWDGSGWRILRVLGDAAPWPVIAPSDVREGMLIERRKGEVVVRGRVSNVAPGVAAVLVRSDTTILWSESIARDGWTLHAHPDDAPTPDPDADLIEAMAEAMSRSDAYAHWPEMSESDRDERRRDARAALAAVRAHDARAEQ